jgi:uncharacterized membrane protein YsdA (DUF1294 family)
MEKKVPNQQPVIYTVWMNIFSLYNLLHLLVYGVPKKKTQKKEQLVDFPVLVDEPMGK